MKVTLFILLVTLICIDIAFPADWHRFILESGSCSENAICLDSNDRPHILYYNYGVGVIRYASWDGSKWIYETISDDGKWYGALLSMAFDKNDIPHISFYEWNYADLMYGYKEGDKWIIQIIDNEDDSGLSNSIALDSKGYPHIAYVHSVYSNPYREELKYAYFDGTKWDIEVVDSEMKSEGDNCSIALDSKDHPHIVYRSYNGYDHYLSYIYFDGNNWIKDNLGYVDSMPYNSIVIDKEDRPHISFYKGCQPDSGLYYAYKDSGKWNTERIDTGYISSIKLDENEYPCIVYSYTSKLKFARWNGTKWDIEVAATGRGLGQTGVSLAFDSDYKPHISCDEYLDEEVWYVWFGYGLGISLTSFSATPHNDAITLNWSVSTDEDISGFNLYRRVATKTNPNPVGTDYNLSLQACEDTYTRPDDNGQWTKINTSLITGTNPYSYTDRDVLSETSYEYKLTAVVSDKNETLGTTSVTSGNGTPASFNIVRIYPTPADDRINIDVVIPSQSNIDISIYDIAGRKVSTIAGGQYNMGEYKLASDVSFLANGVYIVIMTSEGLSASKNFVVAR